MGGVLGPVAGFGFGVGGGGGLHFRNPVDTFTGATLAAARTRRTTYFSAAANKAALAEFQQDEFLAIIVTDGTNRVFETYVGNVGDAYSAAAWVARTDAIQGDPGPTGPAPTAGQMRAAIGLLLNALPEYVYDADNDTITFALPDDSVTAAMVKADDDTARGAWRGAIGAAATADLARVAQNLATAIDRVNAFDRARRSDNDIRDLAGALLATLPILTYDTATHSLTLDLSAYAQQSALDALVVRVKALENGGGGGGQGGGGGGQAGSISISPDNIIRHTELDGDYTFAAEDLDVAALNAANVDQYEIWIKEETVHTANWTPAADFTVKFNISTSEETQIALTANDVLVPVRLVFRSGGSFVSLLNTWLEIRDFRTGLATHENLRGEPHKLADAASLRFFIGAQRTATEGAWLNATGTFTTTIESVRYEVQEHDLWYIAPFYGKAILVYRPDPSDAIQDAVQNTAVLLPVDGWMLDEQARTLRFTIAGLSPGDLTYQRVDKVRFAIGLNTYDVDWALADGRNLEFAMPANDAAAITQNLTPGTDTEVGIFARFHATNGGAVETDNQVAELRARIPVVRRSKLPRVIQAAVDGGDTAGVNTITLPTDYQDYHHLTVAVWGINQDRIVETELHTGLLAVQSATRTITIGAQNQGRQAVSTWNPTTRVLASTSGNHAFRIIYAALED